MRPVSGSRDGDEQHRQRPDTLRSVNEHTFDVRGRRWPCMKARIAMALKLRASIGVLQCRQNVDGVEQDNQMLRQVGHGVQHQRVVGEQYRPGLSDAKTPSHDRYVDIDEVTGPFDVSQIPIALIFSYG